MTKIFKGNPTYFERKSGTLEDIVSRINEASPKPEVFDLKKESDEYKAVFQAAMKKFKINSPADLKSDEEKKKFFDYVDSKYKAPNEKPEQVDPKAKKVNQSQMAKDGEEEVKKSVRETVQDLLLKSWKQAAQVAEEKHKEKKEEKVTCPKCEGKGCDHCEGKGYHMKEEGELKEASISVNDISYSDMPKSKLSAATRKFRIKMKKLPKNKVYPGADDAIEFSGSESDLVKFFKSHFYTSGKTVKDIQKEL